MCVLGHSEKKFRVGRVLSDDKRSTSKLSLAKSESCTENKRN